jgi:hypothetical protein
MLNTPNSNYYSITINLINQLLNKSGHDSISLFHFNVRSLPKNVSILNDFLYTLDSRLDIAGLIRMINMKCLYWVT